MCVVVVVVVVLSGAGAVAANCVVVVVLVLSGAGAGVSNCVAAAVMVVVVLSGAGVREVLVFNISGSVSRRRLHGYHPRSAMALLLVLLRPKDLGQTIFTRGKQSDFSKFAPNPIRMRY